MNMLTHRRRARVLSPLGIYLITKLSGHFWLYNKTDISVNCYRLYTFKEDQQFYIIPEFLKVTSKLFGHFAVYDIGKVNNFITDFFFTLSLNRSLNFLNIYTRFFLLGPNYFLCNSILFFSKISNCINNYNALRSQ